ncbi:hypothetical protein BH10PLA1_BH10PLA1_14280 [soil metagenome]
MVLYLRSLSANAAQTGYRPNASTTIGWISIAVGLLTIAVAWIPYFGMLAIPMSLGGAVLAIAGIIVGRAAGQRVVLLPLVGFFICGISIAVSYLSTVAWQNRAGAPGKSSSSTPSTPAIDMRGHTGPFVPTLPPPVTQPTFVMPKFDRPTDVPTAQPTVERAGDRDIAKP